MRATWLGSRCSTVVKKMKKSKSFSRMIFPSTRLQRLNLLAYPSVPFRVIIRHSFFFLGDVCIYIVPCPVETGSVRARKNWIRPGQKLETNERKRRVNHREKETNKKRQKRLYSITFCFCCFVVVWCLSISCRRLLKSLPFVTRRLVYR